MMKMILAAVGVAAATMAGGISHAQNYPSKPIHLIVGYAPGGGPDVTARILAELLAPRLGQPVVVENRPGAGGLIGADYVAKSPSDGHTLLLSSLDTLTTLPALKSDMPYNVPDLTFIAKTSHSGMFIAVHPSVPAKTFAEFIAYAKANPGKVRFGSNGVGAAPHLAAELLMKQTGVQMQHILYKGIALAMTDLVGGHIDMVPLAAVAIAPYVNTDKLRILAYTAPDRHENVKDTPTLAELGLPKATVMIWYSVVGPPGIPAPIADRLRKEIVAVLQDPAVKEKLSKLGSVVAPVVGDDFKKMVADEVLQWKELAKTSNIVLQN